MYYGVEQSTDLRCPNTIIKKFTSIVSLKKWMINSGKFTHSNPELARNYHHNIRYGYKYFGRIDKRHEIFKDYGSRDYPQNDLDRLARYLYVFGKEILQK